MARELREKKFTNDADIDVVASLYEQGFVRAFDTFRQYESRSTIYYEHLSWGSAQVPTLRHCGGPLRYARGGLGHGPGGRVAPHAGSQLFDAELRRLGISSGPLRGQDLCFQDPPHGL